MGCSGPPGSGSSPLAFGAGHLVKSHRPASRKTKEVKDLNGERVLLGSLVLSSGVPPVRPIPVT